MPELDLDTVVEERSEFDAEVNSIELLQLPRDNNHLCVINHPISFRSFRFGYGASGQPLTKPSSAARKIGSPLPKRVKYVDETQNSPNSSRCSSSSINNNNNNGSSSSSTLSPTGTSLTSTNIGRSPAATDLDCDEGIMRANSCPRIDSSSEEINNDEKVGRGFTNLKESRSAMSLVVPIVSIHSCIDIEDEPKVSAKKSEAKIVIEAHNVVRFSKSTTEVNSTKNFSPQRAKFLGRNSISGVGEKRPLLEAKSATDLTFVHRRKSFPNDYRAASNANSDAKTSKKSVERTAKMFKPTQLDVQMQTNLNFKSKEIEALIESNENDLEKVNNRNFKETAISNDFTNGVIDNSICKYYDSDEV